MTGGTADAIEAFQATTALNSLCLLHCKEGVGIAVYIAFKESNVRTRALLNGSSPVSISIVDRRAVETGWTLALVPSNAVTQWRVSADVLHAQTASDATNIDVRAIDGIVPIPRRDGTGGT